MTRSFLSAACLLALITAGTPAFAGDSGLKVIDQIKVGGDGGWDYATVDAGTHRLYLSHRMGIDAIDLITKAVTMHLADANGAHIALPVNNGADILITNGKADTVTLNDALTGALKATIATDTGPDAAVAEPATGRVFVMANKGGMVDVVDLSSRTVVAKIAAGGAPEAGAADGQGLVFTHLEDKNSLVVIDARTLKVKATYAMAGCDEPSGIAFVAQGRLILSACHNGIARVTSADTGTEVASLPIGRGPDFALYDAARHLGYIPCGDGTLSVISFDGKPHIVDIVATKTGARTGALDATTGEIYLPTADFGPAPAAGQRPAVLPGTFEVVVVGK